MTLTVVRFVQDSWFGKLLLSHAFLKKRNVSTLWSWTSHTFFKCTEPKVDIDDERWPVLFQRRAFYQTSRHLYCCSDIDWHHICAKRICDLNQHVVLNCLRIYLYIQKKQMQVCDVHWKMLRWNFASNEILADSRCLCDFESHQICAAKTPFCWKQVFSNILHTNYHIRNHKHDFKLDVSIQKRLVCTVDSIKVFVLLYWLIFAFVRLFG